MSTSAPAFSRVLCATDLSEFGNRAIPPAFAMAAPAGRVTLLHVLPKPELPSPLMPHYGEPHVTPAELAAEEREVEAKLAALGQDRGGVACDTRVVRAAHVGQAILEEAERSAADAICLATHSRKGLAQLILGSTAHEVLHRAGRPVLLLPSPVARGN